jgi:hypothetical protein
MPSLIGLGIARPIEDPHLTRQQTTIREYGPRLKVSKWKTIGVKVRNEELPLLNRQLDRLSYINYSFLTLFLMYKIFIEV